MSQHSEKMILCTINVRDINSNKTHSITGAVNFNQIFSKATHWLVVNNTFRQNGVWENAETIIYKADIKDITFLERNSYFTYDKQSLILTNSLTSFKVKS